MSDERPDSLAAAAASWVPPWERQQRPPDPEYAAAHRDDDEPAADEPAADELDGGEPSGGEPDDARRIHSDRADGAYGGDDDEELSEAGLSDDDDDFDPAFEGPNPASDGTGVPPELPPYPDEGGGPATVDSPRELPGEKEPDPTDVGGGPLLPMPEAIEQAEDNDVGQSPLVDAPLPLEGDDAGDVFDRAADDDVADDADVDLPFEEDVPAADDEPDNAEPGADSVEPGAVPELDGDEPGARAVTADAAGVGGAEVAAAGEAGAADVAAELGGGAAAPVSGVPASGVPAQGRRRKRGEKAGGAVAVVEDSARTLEELELKPLDEGELRAALEAILLVVDEPVAEMQLAQIIEQPTERVAAALEDISARYTAAGHGFDLRRAAGGWRLYTRPEYAPYVERFVLDGQSTRLTQAALETLAVVAYKQPVTRSRISAIRGVNCDGVMRTLVTRGLIEECGTEVETGAFLYRTTALFLEKLGLNSVDQLPPLAPFLPDDVEEVLDASG